MQNIYIFNPTGEMAMANGTISYMPPKNLHIFEQDLAFLPSFFAETDDTIITENIVDKRFIDQWQQLGLATLNYCQLNDLHAPISYRKLKPWSWNQAIHHKLRHLKPFASDIFKISPNYQWNEPYKLFFSRKTTDTIQLHINHDKSKNDLIEIQEAAIEIYSIEELDKWLTDYPSAIIKLPWSSSGRGIHITDTQNNQPVNYPWLRGAFKQQGFITAEPLLNKQFDFSFQLYLHANGNIELLGISYFINDSKGHFIGGNINWPHQANEMSCFLTKELIHDASSTLIEAIKKIKPQQYYEGAIGVDAIVYKNNDNKLKIHPCVDINWRYNMGMININLSKYLCPNSIGNWKIGSFKPDEWNAFINKSQTLNPLIIENSKIVSGITAMTPPNKNAQFGVWMEAFLSPLSL